MKSSYFLLRNGFLVLTISEMLYCGFMSFLCRPYLKDGDITSEFLLLPPYSEVNLVSAVERLKRELMENCRCIPDGETLLDKPERPAAAPLACAGPAFAGAMPPLSIISIC